MAKPTYLVTAKRNLSVTGSNPVLSTNNRNEIPVPVLGLKIQKQTESKG